ncbi:MAG TPA: redoxin domain-containing protein [Pirellulales bacterium]|nr:redoxin domain-containing protein [Pirellulales bacterium]
MRRTILILLVFAGLIVAPLLAIRFVVAAAPTDRSLVGRQISGFELHDYLGAMRRLDQWAAKKAVVVVFLGAECPIAKLIGPRLAELADRYEDKGVAFIGIDSNAQDSLADIARYVHEHKIEFPILKDPGNVVADLFGAVRTPDAFVLDASRTIRYRGMIDNQHAVGYSRPAATENYVADALDQLLAGKEVSRPATEPAGCFIGRVHRTVDSGAATGDTVTYSKQIAPIFNQHCVNCHREGQVAPFVLTSYDEAAGWAETIVEVVTGGRMPPWHANPEYGHFRNDIRLSDADKELIYAWVRGGCAEGNKADLPQPPTFVEGWRIPQPDLVLKMAEPYEIPDRGVVAYQTFELDADFPTDRWVQAAELRPSNPSVTHHLVLFFHPPGSDQVDPRETLLNLIAGYGPGMPPAIYAPTACRRIPAGSKLMIQAHYTPNGSPQVDQSEVALVFGDEKKVKKEVTVAAAINFTFRIPPGAKDYAVEAVHEIDEDMLLHAVTPHMHLRGKAFRFEAKYPDGRQEVLLDVPRYDFSWQNTYNLIEPKPMAAGTEIICTARFDNSAENPVNPDPTVTVTWGDQTWQEMAVGTMNVSLMEQDLSLGSPSLKELGSGEYEASFFYRPPHKVDAVYLAGSFNDWKPDGQRMDGPDADGRYTTRVRVKPGDYQYKFVLDGKHWRADPGNPVHAGQHQNSVLHVGATK